VHPPYFYLSFHFYLKAQLSRQIAAEFVFGKSKFIDPFAQFTGSIFYYPFSTALFPFWYL